MFDMRNLETRFFDVRLPNGLKLEVEPPKLKVLKAITAMAKIDMESITEETDVFDALADALSKALSKNKQNKTITTDFILENMNIDQMQGLLMEYFTWVGEIQNTKN